MSKRRTARRVTREGIRFGTRGTRIRVPPSPDKPFKPLSKNIIRWKAIQGDPKWYVLHKRGPARPKVGEDPLERRAVSRDSVIGFLSERIVYKWLLGARMKPGPDFDYQSSMQGGRSRMGGIVVDFIFPRLKIALEIQGPTHLSLIHMRKDEERKQILADMGFKLYSLDLPTILDEMEFNKFMRNMLFNERQGGTTVAQMVHTNQWEGHDEWVWKWAAQQLGNMEWGL